MPTRYLKPGVRDSETIEGLSPHAEILYYRLIVTVDDFGRYDARPSMIKAACFPIRDSMTAAKVEHLLQELAIADLIDMYTYDGKPYLQMCKWDNVPRAKESKYPAQDFICIDLHTDVCDMQTDAPLTVTKTETVTKTKTVETPEGVLQSVWDEFVAHRKSKKAKVTDLVIEGIAKEATKAGWSLEDALKEIIVRNWQSFKADWVVPKQAFTNKFDVAHVTTPTPPNQDAALRKIEADAKKAAKPNDEVKAKIADLLKGRV